MTLVDTDTYSLVHGDCLEVLRTFAPDSIDAIVTDPPAGISFMGKEWDSNKGGREHWIKWLSEVMGEALRVLKPGGHALVWAIPRTSHWTATALELAGFEIRDVIMHLFGTGFPKSLNLGDGRGTALKPAAEHWILCRKPLAGTVAANVEQFGTGALNIDACRIEGTKPKLSKVSDDSGMFGLGGRGNVVSSNEGRWPANVTLDEDAAKLLDEQSTPNMHSAGSARDGSMAVVASKYDASSYQLPPNRNMRRLGDSGGAARFFYCAKASRSERELGCEDLPVKSAGEATDREDGSAGLNSPRAGAGRTSGARNHHPTVKPLALMRYLIKLITPPEGIVLDPFMGSGSTGIAARQEGFCFIGIEREPEYFEIASKRIAA